MPSSSDDPRTGAPEPARRADQSASSPRTVLRTALALLAAAVVFAVFTAKGRPGMGLAVGLIAGAFVATMSATNRLSDRNAARNAAREANDERGRYVELRARSVSWIVTLAVLSAAWGWHAMEYGARSATPYTYLLCTMVVSYTGAWFWLRHRS